MIRIKEDPKPARVTKSPKRGKKSTKKAVAVTRAVLRETVAKMESAAAGRPRVHATAAERQKAYRERQRGKL